MARAFAWARAPALELSIKWPKYREACERSSGFPGVYLPGYIFHSTFSRTFLYRFRTVFVITSRDELHRTVL